MRATPKRKNAEAYAPSMKYFSEASWLSSRRRRASAQSRYSGSEKTSSAMNMVSRSFAATKISMPPIAKVTSGYTSVVPPAPSACRRSSSDSAVTAAWATKAPPRSTARSPTSSSAMAARIRMAPWRKSVGPSTAMA
ncbi:hypothetical protein GCM10027452_24790 [Micromonospora halotolerans]